MRVNVEKDREEATVHTMNPVHRSGPVFYASLPCDTKTPEGHETNGEEARHRLVSILWDHLVAMGSPLWTSCLSSNRAEFPIQVVRDPLGKPHLMLGAHRGPAISFSEGGGKVWAALCGMSPMWASTWQRPPNSGENTPFTGSLMHKSFSLS